MNDKMNLNASHTDAERHYFGKDHLGSVRAVTNQWGSPLYMFDYDVFGTPLQDRPERFRHGFTGKEYDSWTGLYNYGFRDYASLYGRFTMVDPIQDGLGWYAYAVSDPVNWLDNWGLCLTDAESGEDTARNAEATGKAPAHWRDNGDGTWTVTSEGATLWEVWGADWDVLSGIDDEAAARNIHVGDTFGYKYSSSTPNSAFDLYEPKFEPSFMNSNTTLDIPYPTSEYVLQGITGMAEIEFGIAGYIGVSLYGAAREYESLQARKQLDLSVGSTMMLGYSTSSVLIADGIGLVVGALKKKQQNPIFWGVFSNMINDPMLDVGNGLADEMEKRHKQEDGR